MTFDQYLDTMGIDSEQFKEDMKKQAKDLVKQDLALDAWARHFNIEATDEEITAEFALHFTNSICTASTKHTTEYRIYG